MAGRVLFLHDVWILVYLYLNVRTESGQRVIQLNCLSVSHDGMIAFVMPITAVIFYIFTFLCAEIVVASKLYSEQNFYFDKQK